MEVERGKTTTNNMDLLDIYKCHICEEANHLFLFVPIEVSHTKNIYKSVCKKFTRMPYFNMNLSVSCSPVSFTIGLNGEKTWLN